MNKTLTLPDIEEVTENDGFAHHVRVKALMAGGPVVALCGKKFLPRVVGAAVDLPLCPKCEELMGMLELLYGDERTSP